MRVARIAAALAILLACTPPVQAAHTGLAQLLTRARLAVVGQVASVTPYDSGRITVGRVRVGSGLKGDAGGAEVSVVERHDFPSSPNLLAVGDHAVLLLVPAARTSSLRAALPEGRYYEVVEGRAGVLSSPRLADIQEVAGIMHRLLAAGRGPDPVQRAAAKRALIFDEIAARHPALVADGAEELGVIPGLATTLTGTERQRLEAALARTDLPVWVRVLLVDRVGQCGLAAVVPALRRLPDPTPELLRASWDALIRLGAAPSADDFAPVLKSRDPAVRAAAAHGLIAAGGAAAIEPVADLALGDSSPEVREAALVALGESKLPAALPTLERAFTDSDSEGRQAAGRAIQNIGGQPAAESLGRLAFEGPPEAQKYAVLLLMLSGIDRDDPLLARIRTTHPDADVRGIAEHGLEMHEH